MSENAKYWIWLQNVFGYGAKISKIIDEFGGAKELYNLGETEWRMSSFLTNRQVEKLISTDIEKGNEVIDYCLQQGYKIVDYDDESYPNRLKDIPDAPAVLYVDGILPDIDNLVTIAMVGSRKASEYAVRVARVFGKGLTEAGASVISGGALGIDSYSHEGALVTEYQPFTKASGRNFPVRNRIISGLSLGVLVVEAGVRSGTFVTTKRALEQKRDLYAVPAPVLSVEYGGTNKLIENGAGVAINPVDVVKAYADRFDTLDMSKLRESNQIALDKSEQDVNMARIKPRTQNQIKQSNPDEEKYSFKNVEKSREHRAKVEEKAIELQGNVKIVYDCLDDEYNFIDDVIAKSNLPASSVLAALTVLEIKKLIISASGKRFKKS
ncbi:MAG: DNA-processing protein DprA [Eubacterium sp.]